MYLFSDPPIAATEEFIPKKSDAQTAITLLEIGRTLIAPMAEADDAAAEDLVKAKAAAENVKLGDLLMPLRVALTGTRVSPPLFGSVRLLGEAKCLDRIDQALAKLKQV
jgi:glutamyl-tRNA synthetase